jgi:hypothetical protein
MYDIIGKDDSGKVITIEVNMTEAQAFKYCESCNWIYDNRYKLEIKSSN